MEEVTLTIAYQEEKQLKKLIPDPVHYHGLSEFTSGRVSVACLVGSWGYIRICVFENSECIQTELVPVIGLTTSEAIRRAINLFDGWVEKQIKEGWRLA